MHPSLLPQLYIKYRNRVGPIALLGNQSTAESYGGLLRDFSAKSVMITYGTYEKKQYLIKIKLF